MRFGQLLTRDGTLRGTFVIASVPAGDGIIPMFVGTVEGDVPAHIANRLADIEAGTTRKWGAREAAMRAEALAWPAGKRIMMPVSAVTRAEPLDAPTDPDPDDLWDLDSVTGGASEITRHIALAAVGDAVDALNALPVHMMSRDVRDQVMEARGRARTALWLLHGAKRTRGGRAYI